MANRRVNRSASALLLLTSLFISCATSPQSAISAQETRILLRREPGKMPEWVPSVPQSETHIYFTGTSQPFDTVANARNDSRENTRVQVLMFYGQAIENQAVTRSTITGSTRDTLYSFVNREEELKTYAQNVVSEVSTVEYYTEVYLSRNNKEEYIVYTLCRIERKKAEKEIANFAKNISERYTNLLPQGTTLKAALEGYTLVAKALEQNPLHRITAYYEGSAGRTGLYEYVLLKINELANSISFETIPARTIQKTETLETAVRLKPAQMPAQGLNCQVSIVNIDGASWPFTVGSDNSFNFSIYTDSKNITPGRYNVQLELLLQELTGGIGKNIGGGFSFEVAPLNTVFETSDDMEAGIKKTVDTLAARLQIPTETRVGPFTLTGTDVPTGLSRFLNERVTHYARNNPKFRIVENNPKAALTGFFTKRNDRVDVTLELITDNGDGDGSQIFSLSVAELARLDISIEPENLENWQERERIFSALLNGNSNGQTVKINQAVQDINIQVRFNSESRTYFHRDELKMMVTAATNCWFKILHIDANNQMKMIYPNSYDTNNYLFANRPRSIFENAKYMLYSPYGTETILVVTSPEQFKNIEQEYIAPWTAATAENIRSAVRGYRGGDLEMSTIPIYFSGEGEARYSITILKPHEEHEYKKPENMIEAVETMRSNVLRQGGIFEGSEISGFYVLDGVRGSYRIARNAPDKLQMAVYYLHNYSGGSNAGARTRGAGFNFSFEKPRDISRAVQAARTGIENSGGTFIGDEQQGSFKTGGIGGQYRVSDMVNVIITEKPFAIPNSLIEKEIKNYFAGR